MVEVYPPSAVQRAASQVPVPGRARELGVPLMFDLLSPHPCVRHRFPAGAAQVLASQQPLPARSERRGVGPLPGRGGLRGWPGLACRAAAAAATTPSPPQPRVDDYDDYDGGGEPTRAPRPHAARLERVFACTEAARLRHVLDALLGTAACAADRVGDVSLRDRLHKRLVAAVEGHSCQRVLDSAPLENLCERRVLFVDVGGASVEVMLPTFKCGGAPGPLAAAGAPNLPCCDDGSFELSPLRLGFVGNVPIAPAVVFSIEVRRRSRSSLAASSLRSSRSSPPPRPF